MMMMMNDDVSSFNYWTKINPFTCQTRVFTPGNVTLIEAPMKVEIIGCESST